MDHGGDVGRHGGQALQGGHLGHHGAALQHHGAGEEDEAEHRQQQGHRDAQTDRPVAQKSGHWTPPPALRGGRGLHRVRVLMLLVVRHDDLSGCGSSYRSQMSHRTVPHPSRYVFH
jgi:hypothetical protein